MAESFTNEPIDVTDLPQLRDEAFVPVDPRYLRASLISLGATAVVIAVGGWLVGSQAERPWTVAVVTAVLLGLVAARALFRVVEVRRLAYQVRAHDLSVRSGVMTHRTASIPFARVQHVGVHRGAVERALGLATLQVSSAGPNIAIPGLAETDAERIKLLVTERAGDIEDPTAAGLEPDTPWARTPMTPPPPTAPQPMSTTPPPPAGPTPPPPSPPPPSPPPTGPIGAAPPEEPPAIAP